MGILSLSHHRNSLQVGFYPWSPGNKEMEVGIMDFSGNYSFEKMVERAVRNAKPRIAGDSPRWVAVMDTFATGSTTAYEICRHYGLDPNEKVLGIHCISCSP